MKNTRAALLLCFCIVFLNQPDATSTLEKTGPSFASQVLEELRLKPPLNNRQGTLIHVNRYYGTSDYYDFHKPERSQDPEGPDKPEWKRYVGRYQMLIWGRSPTASLWITMANGYLTVNGGRCREHLPGLFFTYNGEALDFRGTIPTFRNIMLYKKR